MSLKDKIDLQRLPEHIAIIMDGNGRWAKERGQDRLYGHHEGVQSVRQIVEACAELKISYLTLYAFSTENWDRPQAEVDGIMELLVTTIRKEIESLHKNNIRLHVIGETEQLPALCQQELKEAMNMTADNIGLNLVMALSYSARWEIARAARLIAEDVEQGKISKGQITPSLFGDYLCTRDFPNPELMIRTSGEYRISNFLLYQLAYAELYFTDTLWPDFRKENLYEAIIN
ncbi:MAG: isoprenyl transferase, partial [Chitinophagaceae bacterium]